MLPSLTRYYLLDVFTDRPFAGNPLAVFLDADGLEAERMQAIANELNLAETVFVGRAQAGAHFPLRIFTPDRELPFAGHPCIGTAHLLAAQGLVDNARSELVLDLAAGPLKVTYEGDLARFRIARAPEVGTSTLGQANAAELAGLAPDDIAGDPVQASCGLPFHLVPLASVDALSGIQLASSVWHSHVSPSGVEQVYFYVSADNARQAKGAGTLHARMFSRHGGSFVEDPATGSAAAALAGFLGTEMKGKSADWRIHQGDAMGRPSLIHARAQRDDKDKVSIEIAGQAVLIGEGGLYPQPGG
ncbi:PhzF family phenazine biosynthesis protein [Halomonas denitrificans]|uniref:PhzF family phenazine biosynthesis protein n=1 Tax=Halomonas denitrificans TaxID=370769 RepID=UPI001CD27A19|nr:PhzF family phenazine biosynthesis protein [Halomonas denitrificans]MCA0974093.1 PhzF family phenazine biosynthesis protein [Halomonas denitrificans]